MSSFQTRQLNIISSDATLQFTLSVSQSVRNAMKIFWADIEDRQLKFEVKIPVTSAHLVHKLFCPSVCSMICFKRHKLYLLKVP